MRNLILLFVRFNGLILFLGFEVLCFYLIVNFNKEQRAIYVNSSQIFVSKLLSRRDQLDNYLMLDEVNDSLAGANAQLIEKIIQLEGYGDLDNFNTDSFPNQLIPAKVVNQTIHLRNNSLTINKGSNHGIKNGMGVISHDGIVGIVINTSPNFSQINSILNSNTRISVSIKSKNYFGNLLWNGSDPTLMELEAIPKHANISTGDTIVTSGYSRIFPPDIQLGYIHNFRVPKGQSNYLIQVILKNDPSSMKYVFVVSNNEREELSKLEAMEE